MKINNRYLIKTQNGFQKFLGVKKSDEHNGLRIVFDDGSEIKCTLTHRIQASDGFVFAKNIKVQDVISGKTVKSIEPFYGDFFDPVEVENGNTYTCNEIEHHNCSIICVDECISGDSIITIRNKTTGEIENITVKEFYERQNYRII